MNPMSAARIISLGCSLSELLSWSVEEQKQLADKLPDIPSTSLDLFFQQATWGQAITGLLLAAPGPEQHQATLHTGQQATALPFDQNVSIGHLPRTYRPSHTHSGQMPTALNSSLCTAPKCKRHRARQVNKHNCIWQKNGFERFCGGNLQATVISNRKERFCACRRSVVAASALCAGLSSRRCCRTLFLWICGFSWHTLPCYSPTVSTGLTTCQHLRCSDRRWHSVLWKRTSQNTLTEDTAKYLGILQLIVEDARCIPRLEYQPTISLVVQLNAQPTLPLIQSCLQPAAKHKPQQQPDGALC